MIGDKELKSPGIAPRAMDAIYKLMDEQKWVRSVYWANFFVVSWKKKKIKEDKNNKKKGKGCGLALLPKVLKLRVLEKFPFKNYKLPNSP